VSTLDVLVRGGDLVDGTGAPRRRADVGIRDGRVVGIGELEVDDADRVIDAGGLAIAPGVVDIHTHYDAQVLWDPACTPSPLHGVTTVVSGNCGFTLAPIEASEIDYLVRMLSRVEGIPLDALYAGVDFSWKTFGEYLDRLEGAVGLNIGFLAGHSAIRRVVMGERGTGDTATESEVAAMGGLLRDSLAAGALGFSSSQSVVHNDYEGNPVPARFATNEELIELARIVGEYPGTVLEFISPSLIPLTDESMDLMGDMALAAGRSLNWNNLNARSEFADAVDETLRAHERIWARGADVVPLTYPAPSTFHFTLASTAPFAGLPEWGPLVGMTFEERMAVFADADARRRLAGGAESAELVLRGMIAKWATHAVVTGFSEQTRRHEGRVVGDIAAELGRDPFDVMLDLALVDDLRTVFKSADYGDDAASWALRRKIWRDGKVVIGASDAGAHVDNMVAFAYATKMLASCRDRNVIPLEEAVHLITDVPARLYGITGRGRVAEGAYADLMVFDPDTIRCAPAEWREDLPAGAGRMYAEAEGIEHVLVNGTEIVRGNQLTGALPGRVLRGGRDTTTPIRSSARQEGGLS
jgi:N-acyl-D-aspartate/D-glutamate deacylase